MGRLEEPSEIEVLKYGDPYLAVAQDALMREFNRPVPPAYEGLIQDARFCQLPTESYSNQLVDFAFEMSAKSGCMTDQEEEFRSASLSSHGEFLQGLIAGRDFFDLGCGVPSYSVVPRWTAERLGVDRYFGIDLYCVDGLMFDWDAERVEGWSMGGRASYIWGYQFMQQFRLSRAELAGDNTRYWVKDDILGFVSKMPESNGSVFLLAGIQGKNVAAQYYLSYLACEINRVTQSGDAVITIGFYCEDDQTFETALEGYGFTKQGSKGFHIFVKQ